MSDEIPIKIKDIIARINEIYSFIQTSLDHKDSILERLVKCQRELKETKIVSSMVRCLIAE